MSQLSLTKASSHSVFKDQTGRTKQRRLNYIPIFVGISIPSRERGYKARGYLGHGRLIMKQQHIAQRAQPRSGPINIGRLTWINLLVDFRDAMNDSSSVLGWYREAHSAHQARRRCPARGLLAGGRARAPPRPRPRPRRRCVLPCTGCTQPGPRSPACCRTPAATPPTTDTQPRTGLVCSSHLHQSEGLSPFLVRTKNSEFGSA